MAAIEQHCNFPTLTRQNSGPVAAFHSEVVCIKMVFFCKKMVFFCKLSFANLDWRLGYDC